MTGRTPGLAVQKRLILPEALKQRQALICNKKFSIQINDEKAVVTLPEPQLLSIESLPDVKFEDENGVWNWVDMEDRSKAINAFTGDARNMLNRLSLLAQASEAMEKKLTEILKLHGKEVEIRYSKWKEYLY